jgi:hypothetical protein
MSYFIQIRGKAFGPFDEDQLKNMKAQGKIGKTTEVSENKVDWQPAESLGFLYSQSTSTKPTSPGESLGQQIYSTQAAREPADWFYSVTGTEGYGPVAASVVEQMLRSGQLNANSYVWQQNENARLIKNEPRFFRPGSTTPHATTALAGGDMADIGGEITGTSEQVDTGKMIRPLSVSLGWLMFLKIAFLITLIVLGLSILLGSVWAISQAIGMDNAWLLFITLISLVLNAGMYVLGFKTFLCFWKYHTNLHLVVATGRASDLINTNQSQSLLWKWAGMSVIT